MNDESARVLAEWLAYAIEDLIAAEAGLQQPSFAARHVCNFAQQSAEKALKACLIAANQDYPKTHDLDALRDLLPDFWPLKAALPRLAWLTAWAVEAKYPSELLQASHEDAQRAVSEARQVWDASCRELSARGFRVPS